MNNGQLNIVSVPTVMRMSTQEPTVPVTVTMDGVKQTGGDFADLLDGIQLLAKANASSGPAPADQSQAMINKIELALDPASEEPLAGLLLQLNLSSHITTASDHAVPKSSDSEETDVYAEAEHLNSDLPDTTVQMTPAAYSHPGRMPEVNIPTPIPVDMLQNAASVIEQPVVISVAQAEKQGEQAATALHAATTEQDADKQLIKSVESCVISVPHVEKQAGQAATALHPATTEQDADKQLIKSVESFVISVPHVEKEAGQAAAALHPATTEQDADKQLIKSVVSFEKAHAPHHVPTDDAATFSETASQPAQSDRMSNVNISTHLPVDMLQNVASVTDPPPLFSTLPDTNQVKHAGAGPAQALPVLPVQAPAALSVLTAPVSAPAEPGVMTGTAAGELPAIPAEKQATSVALQSGLSTEHPAAPLTASSPESEIEIQLSQPRPITARATAVPVARDSHPATPVQELHGSRQRLNPEQQIEKKVLTGNEQSTVKEMALSSQSSSSEGGSTLGSDTSRGNGSNQGQPDVSSDNQMLVQQMRGQLSAEHQKVSAATFKPGPAETVRQDIPEQVMQQVKERLVQYDVKPGNQQITLTLSPDSLGELKMNLNLQGQKLSVEIITENRTVRDAIVLHTDALKESLARQNITMDSFDVTTGGKGSGNQGQNQNAWRELAKQQQQFWTSPRGYQTAQADLPSENAAYQRHQGQTMLDIHY